MRMLVVKPSQVVLYTLLSSDGKMNIVPIQMQEGYGIPAHILENENYAWAHEKLSELTAMEMTPLPQPSIEDIMGGAQ